MTTALTTTYATRFASPDFIERAKAQRLSLEVYHQGARVVPVTGTLVLRDPSNVEVINAAIAIDSSGVAGYDLTAASVPVSYAPSQRWLEDWTLTFSDGQVHTFRRDAHLCLRRLYPVVAAADLLRRHHDLQDLVNNGQSLQGYLDEAYDFVIGRLLMDGRYPQQIMTPWGLRSVTVFYALHLAFSDMMLQEAGAGKYGSLAELYEKRFEAEWLKLRFTLDTDESNTPPDGDEEGQSEMPVIYLGGSPSTWQNQ